MFCNYDSAVEDLLNCTTSWSEACSTLLGWLVKLMVLQSWHCLRLPFFGRGITSDLVHYVGHFSVPRSYGIDLLVFLLFLPRSIPLLISSEGGVVHSRPFACFHCCFYFPLDRLVCSMEPSVSSSQLYTSLQYHAHLLSSPALSVISFYLHIEYS